ncbi:MAG: ferrous iron transport protein A [Ruminococcaceae bacterium]|nr:ferrous iron transport protein A [Oscillospiraceae bacterium]
MQEHPLSDIKIGERFCITKLLTKGELRQRLLDLGFVPGTKIECARISPFGDPKAFLIRGALIALRKEDSETILGGEEF